jgi:Putative Flp pilus-assembly TadE/G-like/von Willebrand factor type A domain
MGGFLSKLKLDRISRNAVLTASRWLGHERGSMNVLYAVALIPMVGALGLATDTARGFLLKARLSQAIDQAVLAGGKVYFSPTRNDDVLKYFSANFPNTAIIVFDTPFDAEFMDAQVTLSTPVESGEAGSERLYMLATATVPTTFTRVLTAFGCTACEEITVTAESQVERTIRALDAVISLDMSQSMDGSAKIGAARTGLLDFVDAVYGPTNNASPTLTVNGTPYDLIHIGFVPWNSKVNVTTQGQTFNSAQGHSVTPFDNPVTNAANQSTVWLADNSEVPLIMDPADTSAGGQLPGGWSGCIYARYVGGEVAPSSQNGNAGSANDNDADLVRGVQYNVGSGATQKDWPGWEPMARFEAEPRDNNWTNAQAGPGTRWATTGNWRNRSCTLAYYTDFGSGSYTTDTTVLLDNTNGTIKGVSPNTSRPAWVPAATAPISSTYSGTLKFFGDNTRPYSVPVITNNPGTLDCNPCLTRSIIPLTPDKTEIMNLIDGIGDNDPDGTTNILQGLYWAWEVLMPGEPFDEALVSTPFARDRYIILVTDGAQFGGNGDAYKGRFGYGEIAGDNVNAAHGNISAPNDAGVIASRNNNLDNRLRQLARNIRDEGIKLYVIGFDLAGNQDELDMLQGIASPPDSDGTVYFYDAHDGQDLQNALAQISARLTDVRLSM